MSEQAPTQEQDTLNIPEQPIAINIGEKDTVISQIAADAERLGRPGLVGLTWDQHGLTYQVTDSRRMLKTKPVIKEKGGEILRGVGRSKRIGMKSRDFKAIDYNSYDIDVLTVKIYNSEGELVNMRPFSRFQLTETLEASTRDTHKLGTKDTENWRAVNFRWATLPEQPRPQPGNSVAIPIAPQKPLFEQIVAHQEKLNLPNMVGLTWTRNGQKHQIAEDVIMRRGYERGTKKNPSLEKKPVRVWLEETFNADGELVGRAIFDGEKLQKHFTIMATPPNKPPRDLRWEIPDPLPGSPETTQMPAVRDDAEVWSGLVPPRAKTRFAGSVLAGETVDLDAGDTEISDEEVHNLLIDNFEALSDEAKAKHLEEAKDSLVMRKYEKRLKEVIAEKGKEAVLDTARKLREHCLADMHDLGLEPGEDTKRLNWAIRSLVHRSEVADPFGNDVRAWQQQRELIDFRIGHELERAAWRLTTVPRLSDKISEDGKQKIEPVSVVAVDKSAFSKIQSYIMPEVQALLRISKDMDDRVVVEEYRHLNPEETMRLGRLLRRSIGR